MLFLVIIIQRLEFDRFQRNHSEFSIAIISANDIIYLRVS